VRTYDYAVNYVFKMGWSVIPLRPREKLPIREWKEFQERLPEPEELKEWFENTENNIGIVTGKISNLVVVDADNGDDHPFGLHTPMKVKTSKGFHLYFSYTGEIHNTVRIDGQAVDIRADGGLCVAPPSIHPSGISYKWALEKPKLYDNVPPPFPLNYLETKNKPRERLRIDQIVGKGEGSRNDLLYRFACSLEGKPEELAWDSVVAMNNTLKPPLEQKELKTLFESAMNKADFKQIAKPLRITGLLDRVREMRRLEKGAPSTGYPELDEIIKGFIPSHLYTLTGDTNSGKTSLACNFAYRLSKAGKKVLYLALEPDISITTILASLDSGKNYDELVDEDYKDTGIDILLSESCRTYEQMEQIIFGNGERYDLIIVDHVGYIIPDEVNYLQAQGTLIRKLAMGTKKLKSAILIIAHPRKTQEGKIISINDIAGSASFKQDSTEVMILHREKFGDDKYSSEMKDEAYLQVVKAKVTSRNPRGSIQLRFYRGNAKITTYTDEKNDNSLLVETMI